MVNLHHKFRVRAGYMASVFFSGRGGSPFSSDIRAGRLARQITVHVSLAVVVFAALQIGGIIYLSGLPGATATPYVALAVLLLLAIPFARRLESRWSFLSKRALPCPGLIKRFQKDRNRLWLFALLVPAVWIGAFALIGRTLLGA